MALDPQFYASRGCVVGQISTANTNRDGTGTGPATAILSGGTNGSRVERIWVKATATTTAGMVRIYLWDGSGTDAKLLDEFAVTAITASASVETWEDGKTYGDTAPITVPSGSSITASTHNAETFNVFVEYGSY